MRVSEIMTSPVITVRPDARPKEVAALLVERKISAVPVVDESGTLLGIVSEADLVPFEVFTDARRHERPVRELARTLPHAAAEILTRSVVVLPVDADVAEAARLMLERNVKRIPIVEGGRVVGIVSRRDLLKVLARGDTEIAVELDQLRRLVEVLARSVPGVVGVRFLD